ncbi:hypothetical protein ACH46N_16700 [Streptomyces pristinaespiralis]|jgi:hypothetical protein|uniref:Predicted protein n=2 Tax=Streptomyces pristinaespiralis TaxID=38300 RepID=D6X9K3_STRE2|nr:hypothetical protein [Streptomyces pristinaespiralis]ALC22062.1 hypothetical protein SPRI_3756 [Streptomyces pristinaespiralis]EFH31325.1 predicted protein [Streptomyces pristinaespiralis ATCC 25486]QMU15289.1 hypothetical protein H3L99_18215 [Streptomyces pristinaespiralis]
MKDDGSAAAPPGTAEQLLFTVFRTDENAAPGQTTAIRLIGLLPADSACVSTVGNSEIALGILLGSVPGTPEEIRTRLEAVLTDSALTGWSIRPS